MDIKIVIDPNMKIDYGQYNPDTNTITLKNADDTQTLIGELIHAKQDDLDIPAKDSRSNMEFQEHLLRDMIIFKEYPGIVPSDFVTDKDSDPYERWLYDVFQLELLDTEAKDIDMDVFLDKVDHFYNSFIEKNEGTSYSDEQNPNYDWHWEQFFDFVGIPVETDAHMPDSSTQY